VSRGNRRPGSVQERHWRNLGYVRGANTFSTRQIGAETQSARSRSRPSWSVSREAVIVRMGQRRRGDPMCRRPRRSIPSSCSRTPVIRSRKGLVRASRAQVEISRDTIGDVGHPCEASPTAEGTSADARTWQLSGVLPIGRPKVRVSGTESAADRCGETLSVVTIASEDGLKWNRARGTIAREKPGA